MTKSEWSFEANVGVSPAGLISCNPEELLINALQQNSDSKKIEDLQYLKKEFEEILKVKDPLNKYRELIIPLISKLISYIKENPNTEFKKVKNIETDNSMGIVVTTANKEMGFYNLPNFI